MGHLWAKWYLKAAVAMLAMLAIVACTSVTPAIPTPTPREISQEEWMRRVMGVTQEQQQTSTPTPTAIPTPAPTPTPRPWRWLWPWQKPKLTEEEAIQLVTAYLEVKTYLGSPREISGHRYSCASVARRLEGKFEVTWIPEQRAWRVTSGTKRYGDGTLVTEYEWLVYERTLVVESTSKYQLDC